MQVCGENNGNIAAVKRRKTWDDALVGQALIALKTHGVEAAAKELDVSFHGLRHALSRRGISIRYYRKGFAKVSRPRNASGAFLPAVIASENRPFLAMEAIEAKPDDGCSWPIGDLDSESFSFCGTPRQRRKPYCSECAKRAYEPIQANSLYKL